MSAKVCKIKSLTESFIYLLCFLGLHECIAIKFTRHALKRLSKRCCRFGIDIEEAEEKARRTIRHGKPYKIKQNHGYSTIYYHYFEGGFSFYVACKKESFAASKLIRVKTVIIKWGRR